MTDQCGGPVVIVVLVCGVGDVSLEVSVGEVVSGREGVAATSGREGVLGTSGREGVSVTSKGEGTSEGEGASEGEGTSEGGGGEDSVALGRDSVTEEAEGDLGDLGREGILQYLGKTGVPEVDSSVPSSWSIPSNALTPGTHFLFTFLLLLGSGEDRARDMRILEGNATSSGVSSEVSEDFSDGERVSDFL